MRINEVDKPVTQADIDQLEIFADRLFAKVGIDVEFTRHFLDRVNDERNVRQITVSELTRLFKQEFKKWGKKIAQLGPDAEAVMKDLQTDINMPFALRWDSKNQELDLIAKTVMRKQNFRTPNQEFAVEYVLNKKQQKLINESYIAEQAMPKPSAGGVLGTGLDAQQFQQRYGVTPRQATTSINNVVNLRPGFQSPRVSNAITNFMLENPGSFQAANDNVKPNRFRFPSIAKNLFGRLLGGLGMILFATPAGDPNELETLQLTNELHRWMMYNDPQALIDMYDAEWDALSPEEQERNKDYAPEKDPNYQAAKDAQQILDASNDVRDRRHSELLDRIYDPRNAQPEPAPEVEPDAPTAPEFDPANPDTTPPEDLPEPANDPLPPHRRPNQPGMPDPDVKPEFWPDEIPFVEPGNSPEQPEQPDPDTAPDTEPTTDPEPGKDAPELDPYSDPEKFPEVDPTTPIEPTGPQPDVDPEAPAQPEQPDPDTAPDTEPTTDPEPGKDAPDAPVEPGKETDPDVDPKTAPEPGPEVDPIAPTQPDAPADPTTSPDTEPTTDPEPGKDAPAQPDAPVDPDGAPAQPDAPIRIEPGDEPVQPTPVAPDGLPDLQPSIDGSPEFILPGMPVIPDFPSIVARPAPAPARDTKRTPSKTRKRRDWDNGDRREPYPTQLYRAVMKSEPFESVQLNEGGAMPGVGAIHIEEINPTLEQLEKALDLDLKDFVLGSVGKREFSGDIDVALNLPPEDIPEFVEKLKKSPLIHDIAKSSVIMTKVQIVNYDKSKSDGRPRTGFVQLDFMLGDPGWLKTYYHSPSDKESKYKGVFRNLMIATIAAVHNRQDSAETTEDGRPLESVRYMWSPTDGLVKVRRTPVRKKTGDGYTKKNNNEIIEGPWKTADAIAQELGLKSAQELNSFESLYKAVNMYYTKEKAQKIFKGFVDNKQVQDVGIPNELK